MDVVVEVMVALIFGLLAVVAIAVLMKALSMVIMVVMGLSC